MQQRGPLVTCVRARSRSARTGGKDVRTRGASSAQRDQGARMSAQRVGSCANPLRGVAPILVKNSVFFS